MFINDLPNEVSNSTHCKIFADDTKLYRPSKDYLLLQEDINNLLKWADKWKMEFNKEKCKILHIGKCNNRYIYLMGNINMAKVEYEKDIGVYFDQNLNFDYHIDKCIKDANRLVGLVRRCFTGLDRSSALMLYKSLIRSKLEYANIIWNPIYKRQSRQIEKVQKRAIKQICKLKNNSYSEKLQELKLPSLEYRRTRNDLIQTYKIINSKESLNTADFFTIGRFSRNDNRRLNVQRSNTNVRQHFFGNRVVKLWNKLSRDTKYASDINIFKASVDRELSHLMYKSELN